jgi:branched-chain amino acid transport system substrate-binding protein
MTRRFLLGAVLCAIAAALPAGCNKKTEGGGGETVKVVSSMPRSGFTQQLTDSITNGIKMAFEEADYKAGPFKIEYLDWNDASATTGGMTPENAIANAERAIDDPDVMAYIGPHNTGAAKVALPKLNAAGMLVVSMGSTYPGLNKPDLGSAGEPDIYRPSGKVNFIRVVTPDDHQGGFAAEWAKDKGFQRAYVLDDGDLFGRGVATFFRKKAEELGITVLGHETIDLRSPEFSGLMLKIKTTNPDLVFFGGNTFTKGPQVAKDMVRAGLTAKLLVPDGCADQAFIDAAGPDNVNGRCFCTFGGVPPSKLTGKGKEFVDHYKAKYDGKTPEPFAVYGYECAKVALEAIKRAGKKDRDAVREAGLAIKDFDQGAIGKWSVDANGDISIKVVTISEVVDGKWQPTQIINK